MGYYTEAANIYKDEYNVIREQTDDIKYSDGLRIVTKPAIVIIDNENIRFNFKDYDLCYFDKMLATQKDEYLGTENLYKIELENSAAKSPYSKIKIMIDYGDDKKETLFKPLNRTNSNDLDDWAHVDHFYNFNDKKYYEGTHYITFIIKNIEGLTDKIIIPFTVLNTLAANYNVRMDLISANLTNDNNVAFVFNVVGDNQIVFASLKKK